MIKREKRREEKEKKRQVEMVGGEMRLEKEKRC